MKRILNTIFLIASMILLLVPASAAENTEDFLGGNGTEERPYIVASKTHLNNVRNYPDAYFDVVCDITFTDADFAKDGNFYNEGRGWEPIGSSSSPFNGTFNGNGHNISGLYMAHTTDDYSGLFAYTGSNALIQGVTLLDVEIKGGLYTGGVVAYSMGAVRDCTVTGSITSGECEKMNYKSRRVGGVIGLTYGPEVAGCENYASITLQDPPDTDYIFVGGVIGSCWSICSFSECNNYGNIVAEIGQYNGYARVGGVLGQYAGTSGAGFMQNCLNSGDIIASAYSRIVVGGIVGEGSYGALSSGSRETPMVSDYPLLISGCKNTGNLSTNGGSIGGIAGRMYGTAKKCENIGVVSANPGQFAGGIIGECTESTEIHQCINRGAVTSTSSISYAGGISAYAGTIAECYNSGSITAIGRNDGYHYAGGIVGYSTGNCQDCYNTGRLDSHLVDAAGAIASYSRYGYVGGIAAYVGPLLTISTSYHIGSIESNGCAYRGGLIGYNLGATVRDCYYGAGNPVGSGNGAASGTAATPDEMRSHEIYSAYDFQNIWSFDMFDSYPYPQLNFLLKQIVSLRILTPTDEIIQTVVGGYPDISSITVQVVYADGTSGTSAATADLLSKFDLEKIGLQTAPVSYHGVNSDETLSIMVNDRVPVSIAVTSLPSKTRYLMAEEFFRPSGGELTVYYNNETSEIISLDESMISGFDNTEVGSQSLTVSYAGLTTSFDIEIIKRTKIAVTTVPSKTRYFLDETVDAAGGILTVYYSDGTSENVKLEHAGLSCERQLGIVPVIVSCFGLETSFNISYVECQTIAVSTLPDQTTYVLGQPLNLAGGQLTVVYTDGSQDIIDLAEAECEFNADTSGSVLVTVSYLGKQATFSIDVVNRIVRSIYLVSEPAKLSYVVGERLNLSGSKIRITFESEDNYSEIVPIDDTMISNYDSSLLGYQTIYVTIEDKSTSFVVRLKPVLENIVWTETSDGTTITAKCNLAMPEKGTLIMAAYTIEGRLRTVSFGNLESGNVSFSFANVDKENTFLLFALDDFLSPMVAKTNIYPPMDS